MAAIPKPQPAPVLVTLCDDALFAVAAASRFEIDTLRSLAARRTSALRAAALGTGAPGLESWDAWQLALCTAIAPVSPPRWLPMSDVIESLSLEHGARGVRSLFTSKPSEKEVARVRALGALAVRSLGAVLSSAGSFNARARLLRGSLIASLGLPEEDQKTLNAEDPPSPGSLEVPATLDAKLGRAIVRGAFLAAMGDGMDPREEQCVAEIARKLSVQAEELNAARREAREMIDGSKDLGDASVEAIRYVLEGDPSSSKLLAIAAARLILPPKQRHEALTAIDVGGPVALARRHTLDRKRREAVLALAWIAAARSNPTYAERAELSLRHGRMATDLGGEGEGAEVRAVIDRHLETEIAGALVAAATT
ncbi:MAG: hypothetical protein U0359_11930 [Byssovorax sp.]